ncbi:hypothetical protein BJ170DRAFT_629677 [Xylariales sp. AK1849]|nr:hypothetical protein BJ170DRAFT_629677 [Xylariales sp. AK1849]
MANLQATLCEAFGHIELLPFLTMSYTIAQVCGLPLVRKLSDFVDLKILLILGIVVFSVGAIVTGSAQSMNAVIVGRIVKGLGGSFMIQT